MRRKRRKTKVSYGNSGSDTNKKQSINVSIIHDFHKTKTKTKTKTKIKKEKKKTKNDVYNKSRSLVLNKTKQKEESTKKDIMQVLKMFRDFEMEHTDYRRENTSYYEYENKVQDITVMSQEDVILAIDTAMKNLKKNGKLSKADKKFIRKYQQVTNKNYHRNQGYKTLKERIDEFASDPRTAVTFGMILDKLKENKIPIYDVMNKWKQSEYYIIISTYDTKGLQDYNAEYNEDVQISRLLDFLYREYGLTKEQIIDICNDIGYNPEEHIKDEWKKRGKKK